MFSEFFLLNLCVRLNTSLSKTPDTCLISSLYIHLLLTFTQYSSTNFFWYGFIHFFISFISISVGFQIQVVRFPFSISLVSFLPHFIFILWSLFFFFIIYILNFRINFISDSNKRKTFFFSFNSVGTPNRGTSNTFHYFTLYHWRLFFSILSI